MPYRTGFCSCFEDMQLCCDVFWCPCCQLGRQTMASQRMADTPSCLHCICPFCCPLVFQFFTCYIRQNIEQQFAVGESCFCSFLAAFCCPRCSLCQTGRELVLLGYTPGGTCYVPTLTGMK